MRLIIRALIASEYSTSFLSLFGPHGVLVATIRRVRDMRALAKLRRRRLVHAATTLPQGDVGIEEESHGHVSFHHGGAVVVAGARCVQRMSVQVRCA
jgi:hypothetical protein